MKSEKNKIIYLADGIAKEFAIDFKIFKNKDGTSQIRVERLSDKEISILKENTDFFIEGNGADGSAKVVFSVPPQENSKIGIFRDRPMLQSANFINGQFVDMEVLEQCFDGIYMCLQELSEKISRSIKTDALSDDNPDELIDRLLHYKDEAQAAANEALKATDNISKIVDQLGTLADEINGEII